MAAFLTALASLGAQRAQGKLEAEEEKLSRAEKQQRSESEQAYLDIAKRAEQRQQALAEQSIKAGRYHNVGNRLWDVEKGKFVDLQGVNPTQTLKDFIGTLPSEARAGAAARAKAITESNPNDLQAPLREVLRYADAYQAETQRREDAAARATERKSEQEEGRKFREHEAKESRAFREDESRKSRQFQQSMVDYRLKEREKFMNAQERTQWETIKAVEPMVTRLRNFIEDHKMQDENSYVFGNHSALMQHLRMRGYKFGTAQEPVAQELIKDAAAISIMSAAPWVRIGRGKFTLEQIQQHLPKATDTPANLYDKVSWLQDEVLTDAKQALSGMIGPGGEAVPETTVTPPPSTDPAVQQYLNSIGVK